MSHILKRLSDENLVEMYAAGNNKAFDVLLERHKEAVYSYILFFIKSREIADDIFQETFVKIITMIRAGRYTESGKFPAWVNRIARNQIIDFFRHEKSEGLVSMDTENSDIMNSSRFSAPDIEEEIVLSQMFEEVKQLIGELPEPQREVVEMRFYRNMSFKEIAESIDVSINTALGRMRYAVLNMRKAINERQLC